jgi:hypothetical protein
MKRIAFILSISMLMLLLPGCTRRAELSSGEKGFTAHIRFVHAVPDGPSLSMYMDKDSVFPGIDYTGFSTYRDVVAGKRVVRIFPEGNTDSAAVTSEREMEAGNYYTALVTGSSDSMKLLFLTDDVSPARKGKSKVRFVNAIPDPFVQRADLRETPGDKTLVGDVKYLGVGPYITLKSGKHNFELRFEGLSTTLAKAPDTDLKSGGVYTIVAEGNLLENITLQVYEDE